MAEPWIVRPTPNAAAPVRMICFPYAGGGVAALSGWAARLPQIEMAVVRLPGRESRWREAPCASIEDAADCVAQAIAASTDDRPYALYGHSLGALIAFETARRLETSDRPPVALVVSGRRAPSLPEPLAPVAHLPLGEFARELQRRYGGVPEAVLEDAELCALLLPPLQSDVAMVERYRYQSHRMLSCAIFAYGGVSDPHATDAEVRLWARETSGPHMVRFFSGSHFFVHSARDAFLAALCADLSTLDARRMAETGSRQ